MEFDDLMYYATLAEELNFHRAARRLGVKQPSISRRIDRIERELGAYLVERRPQGVRLTPAGEVLAEGSHRLITDLRRLMTDVGEATTGQRGRLSIGFFTSLRADIFSRVLAEYGRSDEVRLDLYEGTMRQQFRRLREGWLDVALVIGPVAEDDLNTETLWIERLVVILPLGHPQAHATRLGWPELAGERFVSRGSESDHSVSSFVAARAAAAAGYSPAVTEFAASRENIIALVQAGFGIALMPESSLSALNTEGVYYRPLDGPGAELAITAAWLPANGNPALRRFLERINQAAAAIAEEADHSRDLPPSPD